jgi:DNA-binding MarR family transcriptional regulator
MKTLDILISIRRIVRSINLESKRIQKDFGVSIPQLLCLLHLRDSHNYQSTHSQLMLLLSLNSSTVTGIVSRLEAKGLLARVPARGDQRVTAIALTNKGLKLLKSAPNILHEKLVQKIEQLPPGEQKTIHNALETIVAAMQIDQLEVSPVLSGDELSSPSAEPR